jgi:hypothetical protein
MGLAPVLVFSSETALSFDRGVNHSQEDTGRKLSLVGLKAEQRQKAK